MTGWIYLEKLTSLYTDEYQAFARNELCQSQQKYDALYAHYLRLIELRDKGLAHENFAWLKRMTDMIQKDIDEIRVDLEKLSPILEESKSTGSIFWDYETRRKKLEILELLLQEKFKLKPEVKDGQLTFVSV